MEERTTVERRTTVIPDPAGTVETPDSTNVNIDPDTGATTVQTNDPARRETTVRETTVEKKRSST